ncbi:hypothetical protein NPIL_477721 [Nephila pilipes]|uniref:Uncharacterized protein n=1 Tax=Nephila pilipes TaxID=299642 RepID=A0A8X6PXH3_NEPPI|nr:hypothetical protein NPIL_477721 [Nephila pilipes]
MGSFNGNALLPNISTNDVTARNQSETLFEKKVPGEVFILPNSTKISEEIVVTKDMKQKISKPHILLKIHRTITRSKDAVWATITLTFICVLLLVAVAQSRMWKDYRGSESQGVPLPNFNERVLFKDVMEHKLKSLKEIFQKKKLQKNNSEMESLLPPAEWDDESSDIPIP